MTNILYPATMEKIEIKNSHRVVGLKIARLLIKTRTMPILIGNHPRLLKSCGNVNKRTIPETRAKIEVSAAIPLHQ